MDSTEVEARLLKAERRLFWMQMGLAAFTLSLAFLGLSHTNLMREFADYQRVHPASTP